MAKAKINPQVTMVEDRLLIRPLKADSTTAGGIVLPEQAQAKPHKGTVLAVGPGKRQPDGSLHPITAQVGDVVAFTQYQYSEVEIDEEQYYVVRESDLLYIEGFKPEKTHKQITGSAVCKMM